MSEISVSKGVSEASLANLRPYKPGQSGNPTGRPKGIARAFREALGSEAKKQGLSAEGAPAVAARGLLDIALNAKREQDKISAWRELLDRGYGKAAGFAAIEGADPLELDEVAREISAIADQLRARRDAA